LHSRQSITITVGVPDELTHAGPTPLSVKWVRCLTVPRKARMIWVYRCPRLPVRWSGQCRTPRVSDPLNSGFLGRRRNHKGLRRMSTFIATADHAVQNTRLHIIHANGRVLGRIATLWDRMH